MCSFSEGRRHVSSDTCAAGVISWDGQALVKPPLQRESRRLSLNTVKTKPDLDGVVKYDHST